MALFVLWGVLTVIFVIVRVVPGDPALIQLGPSATKTELEAYREVLGLNDPMLIQYWDFLRHAVLLDFGDSFRLGGEAMAHVTQRLPYSLLLAAGALIIGLLISFPLGIIAAMRPGSLLDRAVTTSSLVVQGLPTFWVGIMLILLMSRTWQILPSGGAGTLEQLLMPAVTLSLPLVGVLIRLVRNGLLEVLREGYIQTARSKGLAERIVVSVHGVRNMLIPVITVVGLQFGVLLGGAVVVEIVFSWPGVGRLLIDSISNRDYPVVEASIMVMATAFVLLNLVVDLLYGVLDPRIRVGESQ